MQTNMNNYPSWRLFQEYWESEGLRNVVIEGAIGGIIGGVILGLVISIILCLCLNQQEKPHAFANFPIEKKTILLNNNNANSPTKESLAKKL